MAVTVQATFKVVLLISAGKNDPEKIHRLCTELRCLPGVHQIEAVLWRDWDAQPPMKEPTVVRRRRREPWRPYGALVHIESSDQRQLNIRDPKTVAGTIWEAAKRTLPDDPEIMAFNGADNW